MAKRKAKAKAKKKTTARTRRPPSRGAKKPARPSPRRPAASESPGIRKGQTPARRALITVTKPGLYPGVSAVRYHEDPCPEASVSASLLARVYEASTSHAWLIHPRLNPNYRPKKPTADMEFGTAAHSLLFGGPDIQAINWPNWRKPAAQAAGQISREHGLVPILAKDIPDLQAMTKKFRDEVPKTDLGDIFNPKWNGQGEVVAVWKEDGIWGRARADWWIPPPMPGSHSHRWKNGLIVDYKTTGLLATVDGWSRNLFSLGSDFQAGLYPHGFALAVNQSGGHMPRIPDFAFVVQETEEPFELSVLIPSEIARTHSENKLTRAFSAWRDAFKAKSFPGYSRRSAIYDPPPWELKREELAMLAAQVLQQPLEHDREVRGHGV